MLKDHPDWLFVFGDNLLRIGLGGQAKECRYEPNAVGIATKKLPNNLPEAFFDDNDFDLFFNSNQEAFEMLLGYDGTVVWPANGIGTGLAKLPEKAQKLFNFIEELREQLENG